MSKTRPFTHASPLPTSMSASITLPMARSADAFQSASNCASADGRRHGLGLRCKRSLKRSLSVRLGLLLRSLGIQSGLDVPSLSPALGVTSDP